MKSTLLISAALALLLAACTPSLNLQVAIPKPSAAAFTVVLETETTTGTTPLLVAFIANTPESASYAWYVNDRKLSRAQETISYTFREAGSYEVTVAATNAAGVTDTDSVTIAVSDQNGEDVAVESL